MRKEKKRTITTEQNFNVVKFGKCRSMSSNNKNESSRVASDEYSPCIKILRTDNEGNGDTHESSSSQALTATANANPNTISVENSNIPTKNVPAPHYMRKKANETCTERGARLQNNREYSRLKRNKTRIQQNIVIDSQKNQSISVCESNQTVKIVKNITNSGRHTKDTAIPESNSLLMNSVKQNFDSDINVQNVNCSSMLSGILEEKKLVCNQPDVLRKRKCKQRCKTTIFRKF